MLARSGGAVIAILGAALGACGRDAVDAAAVDAALVDATEDAAVVDAALDAAIVDAPVIDAPVIDAPVIDAPVIDAPVIDAPVIDAPVIDAPAIDAGPLAILDLGEVATDADTPGRMYRDAGYSTAIPGTGRSFWIFADSIVRNDDGTGCWPGAATIVPDGTAATAPLEAGAAHLEEDPDTVCGTAHFLTVSPTATSACRAYADGATGETAGTGYLALWPRSTVGLPGAASVLVFYQAFCNKPLPDDGDPDTPRPWVFHPLDTGVARWDIGDDPPGAAPTVPAMQQWDTLFAGQPLAAPIADAQRGYNAGAVVVDAPGVADDYLYLYRHHATGTFAGKAVQIARVRLDDLALERYRLASAYEYWSGAQWQSTPPADTAGLIASNVQTPDNVSIVWYPPLGRYVMTYSQLLRTTGGLAETQLGVRTAPTPLGPWSAERLFSLPPSARSGDCGPDPDGAQCRHYFAHPEHSRPGGLAFTVVEPTFGGRAHLYELPDALIP